MAEREPTVAPGVVTVVIPAYNQRWCLAETVASALVSELVARCVIVVDACPFGTGEVAMALAKAHPNRVSVVDLTTNLGQSGARNVGLELVETPWVLFLDGDDLLRPDAVDTLVAATDEVPAPDGVLARFIRIGDMGKVRPIDRRLSTLGEHVILRGAVLERAPLSIESFLTDFRIGPPGSWLLRTASVRAVGGFDPGLRSNEDLELMARLLVDGDLVEIDDVVLEKRMHDSQQTADTILQRRTHLAACWRVLRRSGSASRGVALRGIRNCFVLRSRITVNYGPRSTQSLRAITWWLVAKLWVVAALAERALRSIKGPLPQPVLSSAALDESPRSQIRPEVLFIAGPGRSGSTLLSDILGQVPGVVNVGELLYLWRKWKYDPDGPCGCGVSLRSCPFWSAVAARCPEAFDVSEGTFDEMYALREAGPALRFWWRSRGRRTAPSGYARALGSLYQAIAEETGGALIVDSSKLPGPGLVAQSLDGVDTKVVNLTRNPRSIMYSWSKPKSGARETSEVLAARRPSRVVYNWVTQEAMIDQLIRRRAGDDDFIRMAYEDFSADPKASIETLLAFGGRPSSSSPFVGDRTVMLAPTHAIGGNPGILQGEVEVRTLEPWREQLSARTRRVVEIGTWPMRRRLGY